MYSMQLEILYIIEKLSFTIFPFLQGSEVHFCSKWGRKKDHIHATKSKKRAFLDLKSKYFKVKRKEKHNIVNFGFLPQTESGPTMGG